MRKAQGRWRRLRPAHRVGAVARSGGAPYTPAAGAKDLRAVLFNWMWHQGMLKGTDERDMVATLEYQAKGGTIQVDGQPCTLSKFRESTNYQTFSQRIQYTCTRPNKQTVSNIEVVSWQYAWNEDTPGAEIGGTKGKVAAMPAAVQERLIRIWASPQGAAKSALAGTMDTWRLGANPGTVIADGVMKAGNTTAVVGRRGQAGLDLPDSRRCRRDRHRHARCEVHDREGRGHAGRGRPPSSPTATIRTGTTRCTRSRCSTPAG